MRGRREQSQRGEAKIVCKFLSGCLPPLAGRGCRHKSDGASRDGQEPPDYVTFSKKFQTGGFYLRRRESQRVLLPWYKEPQDTHTTVQAAFLDKVEVPYIKHATSISVAS
jgi:hypothetical protein